jgi:hypothetical protein
VSPHPHPLRRGRVAAILVLAAASLIAVPAAAQAAAAASVSVSIDPAHPAGALPSDFLGLSYEESIVAGTALDSSKGNLTHLLDTLTPTGHLRFGGNSMDNSTWWQPGNLAVPSWATNVVDRTALNRVVALSNAAGWKVEYGVNLKHFDQASVADEVPYAASAFGSKLLGVECGNEPDLYPSYSYSTYLPLWLSCANTVGSTAKLIGPNWSGVVPSQFLDDEKARLSFAAAHYYPLSNCSGSTATIAQLLSSTTASNAATRFTTDVGLASARGLSFRMDETNSSACSGTPGVSNVYASALWSIEYMLTGAQNGVTGMNFHGNLDVCGVTYTPICASTAANKAANVYGAAPLYYGMLMVGRMGTGTFLPATSSGSVKAFAVRQADGSTRVLLLDKDAPGGTPVSVQVSGVGGNTASAVTLTGSSFSSSASDVRIQGAQVGADGTIAVPSGTSIPAGTGGYAVSVPTGSAVLLTIPAGGTLPPPAAGSIVGQASGKCLDITGQATANATPIQLWTCTQAANQAWSTTGGVLSNPASGKCLDVAAASTANGAAVQLYDCNGTGAQQWTIAANGEIVNPNSGKCLDAVGKGIVNGTKLQIWTCSASSNQIWSLT